MMESSDHERLVSALRELAPRVQPSTDRAWTRAPALRVIDCVLSLNRNYDNFVVPRLDKFEIDFPETRRVSELHNKIATYKSAHDFVTQTLNYSHEQRANILWEVVCWLVTIAGTGAASEQLEKLEKWAVEAPLDGYRKLGIKGFGIAGFQYLRMLFGANTVKPDIRICGFTEKAIGRQCSSLLVIRLLAAAAPEANVRLRDLDTTIWETASRA